MGFDFTASVFTASVLLHLSLSSPLIPTTQITVRLASPIQLLSFNLKYSSTMMIKVMCLLHTNIHPRSFDDPRFSFDATSAFTYNEHSGRAF